MVRRLCGLVVPCLAVALLGLGGCSKKGPAMVSVSGTVKFSDGTTLPEPDRSKGGTSTIRLLPIAGQGPDDPAKPRRPASGAIKPDGSFTLNTFKRGDGVIPGRYNVAVIVLGKADDPSSSLIPGKYSDSETSGLGPVEIVKSRSDLDFQLEKQ